MKEETYFVSKFLTYNLKPNVKVDSVFSLCALGTLRNKAKDMCTIYNFSAYNIVLLICDRYTISLRLREQFFNAQYKYQSPYYMGGAAH